MSLVYDRLILSRAQMTEDDLELFRRCKNLGISTTHIYRQTKQKKYEQELAIWNLYIRVFGYEPKKYMTKPIEPKKIIKKTVTSHTKIDFHV
jgi:hypothetical protein